MSKTAEEIAADLRWAAWSNEPPADRLVLIDLAAILDPARRVTAAGRDELAATRHGPPR